MTNQKAWMFFNTETPLPKNQEYYTEEEIVEAMQKYADQQLILSGVVNCVYVVTERDNYGEQLFRQVFAKEEQAIEYLSKQGLTADNIDEINEIELD